MKNLFLALALTAFVGSTVVTSVAAATGTVITTSCDCEKCKKDHKDKKCKDGSTCCKSKTSCTTNSTTENKCSKEGNKSCCSHGKTASTTPATTPAKDTKVTDDKK